MKPDDFRRLALALPEAFESEHHGHPDFRVNEGKVFATLGPPGERPAWAMVKVSPELQAELVRDHDAFESIPGAWGRAGCTRVLLAKAKRAVVEPALFEAWRRNAPKSLLRALDED